MSEVRPAEVVRRAAGYLQRHDVESPLPTAEILLARVVGTDRAGLYTRTAGLSSAEARRFGRALCRRCSGTPTQHITGEQGFRRLLLEVRPGVFVPRPETEVLVAEALRLLDGVDRPCVVDVGTGTGAVALSIKDERPDATVFATDRSRAAVELAEANATRLGLDVVVIEGDLLEPLPSEVAGSLHLVVSNPPYVSPDEYAALPHEVRADPVEAVVGEIEVYERLFAQALRWLGPGGAVAAEIDDGRADAVGHAAEVVGFLSIRVARDLAGRDRVVTARSPA